MSNFHHITIVLAADHRGYSYKEYVKQLKIDDFSLSWLDVGAHNQERSDYPFFAQQACRAIKDGRAHLGIFFCGSGVGMVMAANRFAHIYAALVWQEEIARISKEDDNANVITIPVDFVELQKVPGIVKSWLKAAFKEGRYAQRLALIDTVEAY